MNKKLSFFFLIINLITSCAQFNSDTGDLLSNALCGGVNPTKPIPTIPSLLQDFYLGLFSNSNTLSTDEACNFKYQRLISLSIPTEADEQQVKLLLTSSNFDYSHINPDGSDIRFIDSSFTLFDYWIEIWNPSGSSIIWIKVPSSGTMEFQMIYGNATASAYSNPGNVFSYSTPQTSYFELHSSSAQTMNIASYSDENTITVTTSSGTSSITLDTYGYSSISQASLGAISSNGPIEGRMTSVNSAYDSISHINLASTSLGYTKSRYSDYFEVYNPSTSTTASVTISNYNSSGNFQGTFNSTVNPGEFKKIAFNFDFFGLLESDLPLLGFYQGNNTSDPTIIFPPDTDLLGVNSQSATIGITQDSTSGTIYFSSNSPPQNFSGNKGKTIQINTGSASQGSGDALHIVSDKPIFVFAQADSDGSDTFSFVPTSEVSNTYIIPTDSQYIAIASLYSSTISVYDSSGALITSATTSSDGITPDKVYFGTTSNVVSFAAGTRVISDKPFFLYYESGKEDETNILGAKLNRQKPSTEPSVTVGEEYPLY
ncbi:MAG: DUF2341 domain-containing protein [Bdellovibrio sp.]|nr:MAG: DUF2341 domain-containing protein [Bdellovibrio sp.]